MSSYLSHPTRLAASAGTALLALAVFGTAVPAAAAPSTQTPRAILTKPGTTGSDFFGSSASLSGDGNTALVGAQSAGMSGRAYVFTKSGKSWKNSRSPATLSVKGLNDSSYFGDSVSLSNDGKTAVVGAFNATSADVNVVPSAYVFLRPKKGWKSTNHPNAVLTFTGDHQGTEFGYSVSVSADATTILVGAGSLNFPLGNAFVFTRPGNGWHSTSHPAASLSDATSNGLGGSAALNGNGSVAVLGTNSSGSHVYVFAKSKGGWKTSTKATARLSVKGISAQSQFGFSVATSRDGKTILAGSVQDPTGALGRAYVFVRPGASWHNAGKPKARLSYASDPGLGSSVSLDAAGKTALVGRDVSMVSPKDSAVIFKRPAAGWKSASAPDVKLVVASGSTVNPASGLAVSLSGDGKTSLATIPRLLKAAIF